MKKILFLTLTSIAFVLLVYFILDSSGIITTKLDFPTSSPTISELKDRGENYMRVRHGLHHETPSMFSVVLKQGWRMTASRKTFSMGEEGPLLKATGLFQKLGDDNRPVAEITVYTSENKVTVPNLSLRNMVKEVFGESLVSVNNYRNMEEEKKQDILFRVKTDDGKVLAVRNFLYEDIDGYLFLISASAPVRQYNKFAEPFYVFMNSFEVLAK